MLITQQEQTKPCEMTMEVEVELDQVKKAYSDAYREIGKYTAVPGFRKGKAPRSLLEKYVDTPHVMERVAHLLVPPAYEKAVEESGVEPFGDAEYEVLQLSDTEPFKFKAVIPLAPTVELGEYTKLKIDKLIPPVTDEDIDGQINGMRERMAKVEPVERPAQVGDLLLVQIAEPGGEARETVIEVGKNLQSFDAGLTGMTKGETKSIDLVYPEDYEDKEIAGSTGSTTVTVTDVKERLIPELTDDLVKEITGASEQNVETVADLKAKIRESMEKAAGDLADRQVETQIIEKIAEGSTVEFPQVMLDHEVAHRLQDLVADLEQRKISLEDYLRYTNKSFEDVRESVEKSAEHDIKISQVLDKITVKEKIEVTDEDVEAEITKMAAENGYPVESFAAYLDKTDGRHQIKHRVERNKVLEFLLAASNIKNVSAKSKKKS